MTSRPFAARETPPSPEEPVYDPEAAFLFHALRMHETGFIKNPPQKIVARSTDWRFLSGVAWAEGRAMTPDQAIDMALGRDRNLNDV